MDTTLFAGLSPVQAQVALSLASGDSLTAAARAAGVGRTTVYDQMAVLEANHRQLQREETLNGSAVRTDPNTSEHESATSVPAPRKVGRNELCPCGSGKKFKRCCLDKPLAARSQAA